MLQTFFFGITIAWNGDGIAIAISATDVPKYFTVQYNIETYKLITNQLFARSVHIITIIESNW